jgi:predicted phosphodiesterase
MKLKLLSDLHQEWFPIHLPDGQGTILLLSGDICVADYLRYGRFPNIWKEYVADVKRFFFEDCAKYDRVYYIMGNHEHYDGVFADSVYILRDFLHGSNVTLLNNESAQLDADTVLWGGTLWTDFCNENPIYMEAARHGMNDYRSIKFDVGDHRRRLNPYDTLKEHDAALIRLMDILINTTAKNVIVMTHMAPSSLSRHPRYPVEDPLNWAYYSNLEEIILNNPKIKVWVHGHTHDSHNYKIGDCSVLCNPRGYTNNPNTQENESFDINMTFEV